MSLDQEKIDRGFSGNLFENQAGYESRTAHNAQTPPKFESALDFLDKVKTVFEKQPEVYTQFLDIMKDFKAHNIDTPSVITRVKHLFHGHRDLILGFNAFLPQGYNITPRDIDETPPNFNNNPIPVTAVPQKGNPEFDQARNYVKKIKIRFANEQHIYKAFLNILHNYHRENKRISDVYYQVSQLFKDHPDLFEEFRYFLPDAEQESSVYAPTKVLRK